VHSLDDWAVALAAVLWGLTFAIYFALFGMALIRPSLPRGTPEDQAGSGLDVEQEGKVGR
jgi:hypothetical protein